MDANKAHIISRLQQNRISDCEHKAQKLDQYLDLVIKWGARINISGYRDKGKLCKEYIEDGLRLVKYINCRSLVDIGSGAGTPGLVLALVCEGLERVFLTELRAKRISFLKRAVFELGLKDLVTVVDADKGLEGVRGRIATLRAVSDLQNSLQLARQVIERPGRVIMPRGLVDLEQALSLGCCVESYPWAGQDGKRIVVVRDEV